MATITPVSVAAGGSAVTMTAASAGGDTIANASAARFIVNNGGASSITVTFAGAVPCSQGQTHTQLEQVTVAAGATEHIPVPSAAVNPNTGNAGVTYSAVTSVTVAAVK